MKKVAIAALMLALVCAPLMAAPKIEPVKFTLSLALVGLSIADTALTIYGTSHLGLVETNKFLAPFFERGRAIDYFAIWNIQLIGTAVVLIAIHHLIRQESKIVKGVGYALLVVGVVIRGRCVIHNARLHRSMAR